MQGQAPHTLVRDPLRAAHAALKQRGHCLSDPEALRPLLDRLSGARLSSATLALSSPDAVSPWPLLPEGWMEQLSAHEQQDAAAPQTSHQYFVTETPDGQATERIQLIRGPSRPHDAFALNLPLRTRHALVYGAPGQPARKDTTLALALEFAEEGPMFVQRDQALIGMGAPIPISPLQVMDSPGGLPAGPGTLVAQLWSDGVASWLSRAAELQVRLCLSTWGRSERDAREALCQHGLDPEEFLLLAAPLPAL